MRTGYEQYAEAAGAIVEVARRNLLTRHEILESFPGRYTRIELQIAFDDLCRRGLLYRHPGGWYVVDAQAGREV